MIAVLLPTRNKPEELHRILTQISETSTDAKVFAYVADDDPKLAAYKEIKHPLLKMFHGPQLGFSKSTNFLAGSSMPASPDMIMRCEDDFHFVIPGWDQAYLEAMPEDGIGMVWCHYRQKGPGMEIDPHTAAVGRRWYQTLGWFSLLGTTHWWCDRALRSMSDRIQRTTWLPTPYIEHRHDSQDARKVDGQTPSYVLQHDDRIYHEWLHGDGFRQDTEKLEAAKQLDKIAVLTPTRERPTQWARMEESFYETYGGKSRLITYIDENDPTRESYKFDPRTQVMVGPPLGWNRTLNRMFKEHPNYGYYMWGNDDLHYETQNWDVMAIERCPKVGVLFFNDMFNHGNYCFPMVNRDVAHKVGWIHHPNLLHWAGDDVWADIADRTERVFCEDIVLRHEFKGTIGPSDIPGDSQRLHAIRDSGEIKEIVARLKEC